MVDSLGEIPPEDKKRLILQWIAVDLNDDAEFLKKLNRLSFGLIKENKAIDE